VSARARVLVVGAGGLGSAAALALSESAPGRVGAVAFVDDDRVDASNLHRQVIHRAADAGREKARSAAEALARLSGGRIAAEAIEARLDAANAAELVARFDLVLDGSDNFPTKFLVNDACVAARVPFVHAGAIRWGGQWLPVAPGAPCYRCLFEAVPPVGGGESCREAGIAGPVVGYVGARQAEAGLQLLDAIELAGARDRSTLHVYDALRSLDGAARAVTFRHNRECAACGAGAGAALDPARYQASAC
jgi:molybdopterin/thiamine biosynthesis adenylyltransferase